MLLHFCRIQIWNIPYRYSFSTLLERLVQNICTNYFGAVYNRSKISLCTVRCKGGRISLLEILENFCILAGEINVIECLVSRSILAQLIWKIMFPTHFPDIFTVTWSSTPTTATGRTRSSTWRRWPTRPASCCPCSTRPAPSSTSPPYPRQTGRTPRTAWPEVRLEEAGPKHAHKQHLVDGVFRHRLCAAQSVSSWRQLKILFCY